MARGVRGWSAVGLLGLAPLTLAGAVVPDACVVSVDLTAPAADAAESAALQDALDAASGCLGPEHVIEVAGDVTLTAPLSVTSAAAVVVRGVGEERSVLSGGGTHRILTVPDGAGDVTLERVELRDGRADVGLGPLGYRDGGAVWVQEGAGSRLTLRDAIVVDNVALEAGGAIAADEVVVEDVAVEGNTAAYGGALSVGTLVARRATFEGNGTIGSGACGAGEVSVCAAGADAAAADVTAADVATLEGGAVRAGLSVTLENVTFHANRATTGGAIWVDASEVTLEAAAGTSALERGIDATFVTFVGNEATTGAHVAGVDTDGFDPVDVVSATFRASAFLDPVSGSRCSGLEVAAGAAVGSVTNGPGCPGTPIAGTAATLLLGPDDHGAVGRTFLPAGSVVPAAPGSTPGPGPSTAAAPAPGGAALIDAVDCSVGTWPVEDQRGEVRPQGGACEVGATELDVDDGDDDLEDDDPREDDDAGEDGPVPVAVPSGTGPVRPAAPSIASGVLLVLGAVLAARGRPRRTVRPSE